MQVIKIDPYNKEVFSLDCDKVDLEYIYEQVNCECFCIVRIDENNDLILDDNGLLKPNSYFQIDGYGGTLAGYGLVVAHDDEGETVESSYSPQEIQQKVSFVDIV